ncbi:radical SAM protein [Bacillus cereus]
MDRYLKICSDLYKAGLSRVTVSLDSLEEERFFYLNGNRSKVQRVLEGIQAAAEVGMKIKINMVVQRKKRTGHFADGAIL